MSARADRLGRAVSSLGEKFLLRVHPASIGGLGHTSPPGIAGELIHLKALLAESRPRIVKGFSDDSKLMIFTDGAVTVENGSATFAGVLVDSQLAEAQHFDGQVPAGVMGAWASAGVLGDDPCYGLYSCFFVGPNKHECQKD
eukprot:5596525-Amphidinium_carterae.2